MPAGAVYVGRHVNRLGDPTCYGQWGNPFVVAPGPAVAPVRERMWEVRFAGRWLVRWDTRALAVADAVDRFRRFLDERGRGFGLVVADYPSDSAIRQQLGGRDLVCWCPVGSPCHRDVLLEIANSS